MDVLLAKDERIIKSYDYAKFNTLNIAKTTNAARNLTITNKRIIHSEATSGTGTDCLCVNEMPLKAAKYVNVFYGKKSYSIFLLLAIVCFVGAIALLAGGSLKNGDGGGIILTLIPIILGAVFGLLYAFKKDYSISISIKTDTFVIPTMEFDVTAGNSITKKFFKRFRKAENSTFINVKVRVNKEVAPVMAAELGAVILEAANNVTE